MATPGLTLYHLPDGTRIVRMATLTTREDGMSACDWLEAEVRDGQLMALDGWGQRLGPLTACGETVIAGWGDQRDDEHAVKLVPRWDAAYWLVRREVWAAAQALAARRA